VKDIYILGIESSCDETSCSIVKNGNCEINTVILSQIDIHTLYGGVVPEIASRNHVKDIVSVIDKCLSDSKLSMDDIDAVAVAYGPGLVGSLLVGVEAAKTIAFVNKKPLIAVNHMIGHIYANNINSNMKFPLISLVISGGHTELIYMRKHLSFEYIGGTLDDAVGECYDKVARVVGLGYPGGPKVDELSKLGKHTYNLPIPMNDNTYSFSFSGLKSAVINLNHKLEQRGEVINKEDLCKSFQDVVVSSLTSKTIRALKEHNCNNLVISGGVAANSGIRNEFIKLSKEIGFNFSYPDIKYCTDNATMIAAAGYFLQQNNQFASLDLDVKSSLSLMDEKK
jgi:N6-L-threonylcarbamoyladenine synthase